jgi:multiple sugar transport system permease protein
VTKQQLQRSDDAGLFIDRVRTPAQRVAQLGIGAILALVATYSILPLIWLIVASTKSNPQFFGTGGFELLPGFGGEWLQNVAGTFLHDEGIYLEWIRNSVVYSVIGGLGATLIAAAAGYAFGKFEFRGRRSVMVLIFAGVLLPTTILTVPLYLLIVAVGLDNTIWSVLLPGLVSPLGVFLCSIYVSSAIPDAMLDAARIDGAGELRIFFTIVIPQMVPALTTVFLFQFVAIWNNYFLPLIMLSDNSLYPLTVGITAWNTGAVTREPETLPFVITGTLMAVLPLILIFIALQRFWRKGLAAGSITS